MSKKDINKKPKISSGQESPPSAIIRLNRYISNTGLCSRREADKFIQDGNISVNGKIISELGIKINKTDIVRYNGKVLQKEKKVYVLLNKPKDFITTSNDPFSRKTVMNLVENACDERIYPVGRLDRNTTGVLLLTNDGDLAKKLSHPSYNIKKIYHVFMDRAPSEEDLEKISKGIKLEDGFIKADNIGYPVPEDKRQIGLELHSGRNRIVRRVFESLGYTVIKLDRVSFAGLTKKNLKRGKWRYLTDKEISWLCMASGGKKK